MPTLTAGAGCVSERVRVSYRLSEEAIAILAKLSRKLGITQTGVIEQALRKLHEAEFPPKEPRRPVS